MKITFYRQVFVLALVSDFAVAGIDVVEAAGAATVAPVRDSNPASSIMAGEDERRRRCLDLRRAKYDDKRQMIDSLKLELKSLQTTTPNSQMTTPNIVHDNPEQGAFLSERRRFYEVDFLSNCNILPP